MSITDVTFLFVFLPIAVSIFFVKEKWRNYILLFLSMFFYACGSPKYFGLFLFMTVINVVLAYLIKAIPRSILLWGGVFLNLAVLVYYKYYDFCLENVNSILNTNFIAKNLLLPMGVSFFTFKAISLLIDTYRGKIVLDKNPVKAALYLSFFAHIVSGPISRYSDFEQCSDSDKTDWENLSAGGYLFVRGFCKKVLLADILNNVVVEIFAMSIDETSSAILWLGSLCYSLQLYYDFSGYSDIAIGIGKMFGIHCKRNFDYPYCSSTVSEFWRRWHISLGSWFRDYVYIPLGGSRVQTKYRLYFNLAIVWLLTGIWHGANWTFVFWGVVYFVIIAFEKTLDIPNRFQTVAMKNLYRIFTLMLINFQWVIFNSKDIKSGLRFIKHMIFGYGNRLADTRTIVLLQEYGIFILSGIIFSTPIISFVSKHIEEANHKIAYAINVICALLLCVMFICAVSFVIAGQNNPFLYGNF